MHNLGQPASTGHNTSIQAIRKEIYDKEQNEIIDINAENTERLKNQRNKEDEYYMNTHNIDMSNEVPIIPVYTPIVDEHHGVMFVNSSKQVTEACFYHALYDEENDAKFMAHEVMDTETFMYNDKMKGDSMPMVEAVLLDATKATKVFFEGDMYAQMQYYSSSKLMAMYKNELEIPAFIDNGASVNVLPKSFYDKHEIFHTLPKVNANKQKTMTGNGSIQAYFWMDIPLVIQGIYLQLRCIVCDSTADHGLLISRMSLDQLQAIQMYDKNMILLKIAAIPLIPLTEGTTISPNQRKTLNAKLLITDPELQERPIQREAITWITTNKDGFPYVPVVSEYIANQTTIAFRNEALITHSL